MQSKYDFTRLLVQLGRNVGHGLVVFWPCYVVNLFAAVEAVPDSQGPTQKLQRITIPREQAVVCPSVTVALVCDF